MKNFVVEVSASVPYPVKKDYKIACWNFQTAIGRAIKSYRKDIGKKKIKIITVRCERLEVNTPSKKQSETMTIDEVIDNEVKKKDKPSRTDYSIGLDF